MLGYFFIYDVIDFVNFFGFIFLYRSESNLTKTCNENLGGPGQQFEVNEHATKFSKLKLDTTELGTKKIVEGEELEGSKASNPASIDATEFSSANIRNATEYSNSHRKTAPGEGF